MHPVILIFNPNAGGKSLKKIEQICAVLDEHGVAYDLAHTDVRGHAVELARQASLAGTQVIAAVGGDGTVHEVINGLVLAAKEQHADSTSRLAIFPIGTGNDFAASLRFATDPTAVASQIGAALESGAGMPVDVAVATVESVDAAGARAEEIHYFNNNLGIGLEAQVVINAEQMTIFSGLARYLTAALKTIVSYRPFPIAVRWSENGEPKTFADDVMLVTLGNGWRSGGGFQLTPDAKLDDGLLEIGIAGAVKLPRMLGLLAKSLSGKHVGDSAVTMARGDAVEIEWVDEQPFVVHSDGEVLSYAAARVTVLVLPQFLRVIG